jgi:hypothetical protein
MAQIDYFKIIIEGYIQNPNYFSDHLYREWKEAERQYVSHTEFFDFIIKVTEALEYNQKSHYYDRVHQVGMLRDMREEKGISTEDLEDQEPRLEQYSANLFQVTNGRYSGQFGSNDLYYITTGISDALKWVRSEVEKTENHITALGEIPNKPPSLKEIFKTEDHFKLCESVLKEYDAYHLTIRKGYVLFAIIIAFKDKREHFFRKTDYNDAFLLEVFNQHLNTSFNQIKKATSGFQQVKKEVREQLETYLAKESKSR